MTSSRTIRLLVGCLGLMGSGHWGYSSPLTEQIVGRWESINFVITNSALATNWDYITRDMSLKEMGLGLERIWMSASLAPTDTNCQTNLIICVYEVPQEWIDPQTRKRSAILDAELHFTDQVGRERCIPEASGQVFLSEDRVEFNPFSGYSFSSRLTNGVWALEKFGVFGFGANYYKMRVNTALKKANSGPGERLNVWHAEQGRAATGSKSSGSTTNRSSATAGSRR